MRTVLLVGWLMVPVAVAAWHYGPGQDLLRRDDAAKALAAAGQHVAAEEWAEAVEQYDEALRLLPGGHTRQRQRIRLEKAKAQMLASQLPRAHDDLKDLVEELQGEDRADAGLLAEARSALANSQYYMTWLMRLEGQPRDVWEPEVEAARQAYRLMAEQAESRGDGEAARKCREDLESTIRLARMDLSDLQALPLPSQ